MYKKAKFKPNYDELKQSIEKHGGVMDRVAIDFCVQGDTIRKVIDEYGLRPFRDECYEKATRRHLQPIQNIEYAFKACGGVVSDVAKMLGVDRSTVYDYMQTHPHLREIRESSKQRMVDTAEDWLKTRVEEGDWNAVSFVLQTIGKNRGYQKTTTVSGDSDAPITFKVVFDD